jgi:hypothetical protein
MEVPDDNDLYSVTLPQEFSPKTPKGVIIGEDNKPVVGSTGNPEFDAILAKTPPEQREEVLAKLTAPPTPQELDARAREDENFIMSYDQYLVWEPWKNEQEGEFWKSLGEGIDAFKESVAQGGTALAKDPLGSLAKLPASITEGFWQATREFVLMAVDSETPDSIVFKLNNVIRNRGTPAERYNGYVEARKTNAKSNRLYRGEETLVMSKDFISPEVTQVVTWVADPPFLGPAAATLMRGTGKILNTGDMLSRAQMKAQTIYSGVLGGTLKWGAGVPLEAIGGAVSNTIDMGVRKAAGLVEIGTGIAAEDATKFARVAGIGTASAHVAGISIPYAGPIAAASVGGSILESVGTALRLTGEQIVNKKGYKGVFGYARQALMETEEALKKTNGRLSDKTKIFLRALDTVEPVLSYSYDVVTGAIGGAIISGGMGYANAKMDGLGAGIGVGGILGAAGSLTARTILDASGASRRWREQIQMQFGLENLRKSKPNLAHNWSMVFSHPNGDTMSRLQMGRTFVMAESVIPAYDMKAFYGADSGYANFSKRDPARPDVASFEATDAYTIKRLTDGTVEIGLNLDNLFNPSKKFKGLTMAHEFHHVLMRDTVLGQHYGRLFRETTFGVRDQNGILVQRGLVPTNELVDWAKNYSSLQNDLVIRNYLSLVDPDNANDRATINRTKAELIEAVRSYGDDLDVGKPTKLTKTQDDLISYISEEFGSYYYSLWANDKPMEYWLLGGKLEGLKAAMDIAGSAWADHWESRVTRHGTMFDFHKLRKGIEIESVFMKDGKRVRVGALDYLLEDLVRASHSLKNNGFIDISNASKSFIDDLTRNGSDELIGFDPKTKKVRIKKAKEIAVEMAGRGREMAKVLDAIDPSRKTSVKGPDGVHRGRFSDFELDTLVQAGLMSGGMAEKIKLLQRARDNWQNGMPNVFETTYFGASMETDIGPNPPRVRGNKVAIKNRRFLLAGLDFAVGEDGTHKFNVRSIDLKVVERRVAEMFLRPEVRAIWHSTEALARDFFENYLPYMSLDHSVPERQLGSQSIWQEHGSFKRDVMHQIAGFAKSQDLPYANRPMDEIPRGMLSSITDFSIGRMLNIQTDGTNYKYNHENAFWDIARNFSLSNFEKTSSEAGDVYKGKMGHKVVSRKGVNIVFDENGEKIGSYKTVAEVEAALDDNFTKRASVYPDIQKEGFNAVTKMANFSLTNVDASELRRRIIQEMDSGVPWNQTSAIREAIGADAEIPVWAYDEILHRDLLAYSSDVAPVDQSGRPKFSLNMEEKVAAKDASASKQFLRSVISALGGGELPSQNGILVGKKVGLLAYLATTPAVDTRFSLGSLTTHREFYRKNQRFTPSRNKEGLKRPSSLGPYCEIADSLSFQVNSGRVARRSDIRLPSGMPAMSRWIAGLGGDAPVYYYRAPTPDEASRMFGDENFFRKSQMAHMEMAIKSGAKWFLKDMVDMDGVKGVELVPLDPAFFDSIQDGKAFADSSLLALDSNFEIKNGEYLDVRPLLLNRGGNSDGVDITMQKAADYASTRIPRKVGDISTEASRYSKPRDLRETQGEEGLARLSELRRYSISNVSEDDFVKRRVAQTVISLAPNPTDFFLQGPLFRPVGASIDPHKVSLQDMVLLFLKQKEASQKVVDENPKLSEEEWNAKFSQEQSELIKSNIDAFVNLSVGVIESKIADHVLNFMEDLKKEGRYYITRNYGNYRHAQSDTSLTSTDGIMHWVLSQTSTINGEQIISRPDSLDPYDLYLTRKLDDVFNYNGYKREMEMISEEHVTLLRGDKPNAKWDAEAVRRYSSLLGKQITWEKYYDINNITKVAENWEKLSGGMLTAVVVERSPSFDRDYGDAKPFVTLAWTKEAIEFREFIRGITGQNWKIKFGWDGDQHNAELQQRASSDPEFLQKFKDFNEKAESMLSLSRDRSNELTAISRNARNAVDSLTDSKTYESYSSNWQNDVASLIIKAEEAVYKRDIIDAGLSTDTDAYPAAHVREAYEFRLRSLATLSKVEEAYELYRSNRLEEAGDALLRLYKDYYADVPIINALDESVYPWGPIDSRGPYFDDNFKTLVNDAEKSAQTAFKSLAYVDTFKANLADVTAEIISRFPNGISAKNFLKELQNTHNRGVKVLEEAKITGLNRYLQEQAKKPKVNGKDPKLNAVELMEFVKTYAMGVTARRDSIFDVSEGGKKFTLDKKYKSYGNLTVHSTNPRYHPSVDRSNHVLDSNKKIDVSTYAHARFTYRDTMKGISFVYAEELQSNNNKVNAQNAEQVIESRSEEKIDKLSKEILPFVSKLISEKTTSTLEPSIESSLTRLNEWMLREWSYHRDSGFDPEMSALASFKREDTPRMLGGLYEYAVTNRLNAMPLIKAAEGVTRPLRVGYERLLAETEYAASNYGEALYWLVDDFNVSETDYDNLANDAQIALGYALKGGTGPLKKHKLSDSTRSLLLTSVLKRFDPNVSNLMDVSTTDSNVLSDAVDTIFQSGRKEHLGLMKAISAFGIKDGARSFDRLVKRYEQLVTQQIIENVNPENSFDIGDFCEGLGDKPVEIFEQWLKDECREVEVAEVIKYLDNASSFSVGNKAYDYSPLARSIESLSLGNDKISKSDVEYIVRLTYPKMMIRSSPLVNRNAEGVSFGRMQFGDHIVDGIIGDVVDLVWKRMTTKHGLSALDALKSGKISPFWENQLSKAASIDPAKKKSLFKTITDVHVDRRNVRYEFYNGLSSSEKKMYWRNGLPSQLRHTLDKNQRNLTHSPQDLAAQVGVARTAESIGKPFVIGEWSEMNMFLRQDYGSLQSSLSMIEHYQNGGSISGALLQRFQGHSRGPDYGKSQFPLARLYSSMKAAIEGFSTQAHTSPSALYKKGVYPNYAQAFSDRVGGNNIVYRGDVLDNAVVNLFRELTAFDSEYATSLLLVSKRSPSASNAAFEMKLSEATRRPDGNDSDVYKAYQRLQNDERGHFRRKTEGYIDGAVQGSVKQETAARSIAMTIVKDAFKISSDTESKMREMSLDPNEIEDLHRMANLPFANTNEWGLLLARVLLRDALIKGAKEIVIPNGLDSGTGSGLSARKAAIIYNEILPKTFASAYKPLGVTQVYKGDTPVFTQEQALAVERMKEAEKVYGSIWKKIMMKSPDGGPILSTGFYDLLMKYTKESLGVSVDSDNSPIKIVSDADTGFDLINFMNKAGSNVDLKTLAPWHDRQYYVKDIDLGLLGENIRKSAEQIVGMRMFANAITPEAAKRLLGGIEERWTRAAKRFALFLSGAEYQTHTTSRIQAKPTLIKWLNSKVTKEVYSSSYPDVVGFAEYLVSGFDALEAAKEYVELASGTQQDAFDSNEFIRIRGTRFVLPEGDSLSKLKDTAVGKSMQFFKLNNGVQYESVEYGGKAWNSEFMHAGNKSAFSGKAWLSFDSEHSGLEAGLYTMKVYPKSGHESLTEDGRPVIMKVYVDEAGEAQGVIIQNADSPLASVARREMQMRMEMNPSIASYNDNQKSFGSPIDISQLRKPRFEPEPEQEGVGSNNVPMFSVNQKPTTSSAPWKKVSVGNSSVLTRLDGYIIAYSKNKFRLYNPYRVIIGIYDDEETAKKKADADAKKKK